MSYILDALRKADSERERGAVPGLHAQALPAAADEMPRSPRGVWLKVGLLALIVLLLAALAGLLLERDAQREAAMLAAAPAQAPARPVQAPAPALVQPNAQGSGPGLADGAPRVDAQAASGGNTGGATPGPAPGAPQTPRELKPSKPSVAASPGPGATPRTATPTAAALPEPGGRSTAAAARPARPDPATAKAAAATQPTAARTKPKENGDEAGRPTPSRGLAKKEEVPAASAASSGPIYQLKDLPEDIRRELPTLSIGGSVHSKTAADRLLIIHGQLFHEGDQLAPGLTLDQIRLKSAVLRYKGYRYEIGF